LELMDLFYDVFEQMKVMNLNAQNYLILC